MSQVIDFLIVGSGPAGIVTAATLQDAGYSVAVYEKGCVAQAVTRWPIYMEFFSTARNVEFPGFPLIITKDKPTREEFLNYMRRYIEEKQVKVITGHEVKSIESLGEGCGFKTLGTDEWGADFAVESQYVVVATGAYDIPKYLGVPGEELHKVSHYYTEVHPYVGKKVAVVGGKSGAAEAALLMYRAGAEVTLIHRGPAMERIKWWLNPDLENRLVNKEIRGLFSTRILEIHPKHLVLVGNDGKTFEIENDYVIAMTGYRPETDLLKNAGVQVDEVTNRPAVNSETLETNVPGLFVAGVIAAGDISNEIFIENSKFHGQYILKSVGRKSEA